MGYELLNPEADTPATTKSEFLGGSLWDAIFDEGMDHEVPDRLWTSLLGAHESFSGLGTVAAYLLLYVATRAFADGSPSLVFRPLPRGDRRVRTPRFHFPAGEPMLAFSH